MAKQVVILEQLDGPRAYRYLMWAQVPAARQAFHANADAVSELKTATAQELQDIRDGKVIERVETGNWPGMTLAQVQTQLQNRWTAFQADVTGEATFSRYGTMWDGTTWTAGGA
ncbi:MAG TPA: hypothetical protein VIM84_05205 [Gemmatimonadales bacterium]